MMHDKLKIEILINMTEKFQFLVALVTSYLYCCHSESDCLKQTPTQ